MKGVTITYDLENDDWTDAQVEDQEDKVIFIPVDVLEEYIRQNAEMSEEDRVNEITSLEIKR